MIKFSRILSHENDQIKTSKKKQAYINLLSAGLILVQILSAGLIKAFNIKMFLLPFLTEKFKFFGITTGPKKPQW